MHRIKHIHTRCQNKPNIQRAQQLLDQTRHKQGTAVNRTKPTQPQHSLIKIQLDTQCVEHVNIRKTHRMAPGNRTVLILRYHYQNLVTAWTV
jgi:hypothetical protein